jgi:hypothetical protein
MNQSPRIGRLNRRVDKRSLCSHAVFWSYTGQVAGRGVLATVSETVPASMKVPSSRRPSAFGSKVIGSFDTLLMSCFVDHARTRLYQKRRSAGSVDKRKYR